MESEQQQGAQRFRVTCVACDSIGMLGGQPDMLASCAYAWGVENEKDRKCHAARLCDAHRVAIEGMAPHADPDTCAVCASSRRTHGVASAAYASGVAAAGANPFACLCPKHTYRMRALLRALLTTRGRDEVSA